ncbi:MULTISPECIES: hypothetical protein [unclassified Paenibacillus]|uniref:Uncharacterized protein n=1 Tax=Paenibacillus provencensis TaxID=441151 RepID=A0ABW3QH61_9BACL|nr:MULTISPECIES: hypothetical protein [unclassified Paenibacillus]MCM3130173.1 hypothetical protein [Paenibacillus sp. MER 78]SDX71061.1 hypothetical protein SAMN05518848_11265 [Paenibacillus sp. PDC88]SFS88467.1 hypothetical protein SAMN04488601_10661 [Paenibacillus sp. 453mf]
MGNTNLGQEANDEVVNAEIEGMRATVNAAIELKQIHGVEQTSAGESDQSSPESDDSGYRIVDEGGQLSLFSFDAITSSSDGQDKKDAAGSCGADTVKQADSRKKHGRGGAKSKTPVQQAPKEPELESVKLGESWKIHYAATVFEVDVLFQDELNNGVESVTLEEIRLKMVTEEDAAELTPSGTKWRYDIDNKQLFPDAWGQDKGAC